MRQRISIALCAVALAWITIPTENCFASTIGTNKKVSPMPFTPGQSVTIKATASGAINSVTEYIHVYGGKETLCEQTLKNLGPVAQGQTKEFSVDCAIPLGLNGQPISIFVVFLDGDQQYVGEPVPNTNLNLTAHCPKGGVKARPCSYATGQHWAEVTRVKVK